MVNNGGKFVLALLALWVLGAFGCDLMGPNSQVSFDPNSTSDQQRNSNGWTLDWNWPKRHVEDDQNVRQVAFVRTPSHLAIGTFNIEIFGQKKMSKPRVVDVLVDIARQFDVLAIQELREKEQTVIPAFLELINSNGSMYAAYVGPRQGYTSSKEQYVYIYDTSRVEMIPEPYIVPDPHGLLHRPPMVASFRAINSQMHQAFTFTLLNVHTDYDVVDDELEALPGAIEYVRAMNPAEDDIIMLGDFNASPRNLGGLANVRDYSTHAILSPDVATNTRGTHHYDNILIDQYRSSEFTGDSGVIDLMGAYGLTMEEAMEVSDHLPVWGLFSSVESSSPALARQPDYLR